MSSFQQTDLRMAKRRGQLRVEEFITFYKMLTYRPELMHIIHIYSETCDLCTCNGNPTIAMICSKLTPLIESSNAVVRPTNGRVPFPQPFGPPPPMGSITNNYMTMEEVKEFMLNEQKVRIE